MPSIPVVEAVEFRVDQLACQVLMEACLLQKVIFIELGKLEKSLGRAYHLVKRFWKQWLICFDDFMDIDGALHIEHGRLNNRRVKMYVVEVCVYLYIYTYLPYNFFLYSFLYPSLLYLEVQEACNICFACSALQYEIALAWNIRSIAIIFANIFLYLDDMCRPYVGTYSTRGACGIWLTQLILGAFQDHSVLLQLLEVHQEV